MALEGALDHVVEIVRDRLEVRADEYTARGYTVSPLERHDLGSINRLIVLGDAYLELLGWPAGEAPPRPEIADRAPGLDAIVFRSVDAQETRQRLLAAGFEPGEVAPLSRPARVGAQTRLARFRTVRFARQPIDGIRVYWCEHLTPECVWQAEFGRHANGARSITAISIAAAHPDRVAATLAALTGAAVRQRDGDAVLALAGCELRVHADSTGAPARIARVDIDAGTQHLRAIDGR